MAETPIYQRVTRIDQSPMNRGVWCVELGCGHEEWVTRSRRPTAKEMRCQRCEREEAEDARHG